MKILWTVVIKLAFSLTIPEATLGEFGFFSGADAESPPKNGQGDLVPCEPTFSGWNGVDWFDSSQGFHMDMHFGVYLFNSEPEKACGDIYKMKVGGEEFERYVFIMGHQKSPDHVVATLQIHQTLLDSLPGGPQARLIFEFSEADGDYGTINHELPVRTAAFSGSVALFPECDPPVPNPKGLAGASLVELFWDSATFPGQNLEEGEEEFRSETFDSEDIPKCGDVLTLSGVDSDGTTGQMDVLVNFNAAKGDRISGEYAVIISPESCKSLCADDSCPEMGMIAHTCLVRFTMPTRGPEMRSDATTPDDTTSFETDPTTPEDTTPPEDTLDTTFPEETEPEPETTQFLDPPFSSLGGNWPTTTDVPLPETSPGTMWTTSAMPTADGTTEDAESSSTGETTDSILPDFERIISYPWVDLASCSTVSCLKSDLTLDVGEECGSAEKPCPAQVHGGDKACGMLLEVMNPNTKKSTYVVVVDGSGFEGDIQISANGWKEVCPIGCTHGGITRCEISECQAQEWIEEDYCGCVNCKTGSRGLGSVDEECKDERECSECEGGQCLHYPGPFKSREPLPLHVRDTKQIVPVGVPRTSSAIGATCAAMTAALLL